MQALNSKHYKRRQYYQRKLAEEREEARRAAASQQHRPKIDEWGFDVNPDAYYDREAERDYD